MKKLISLIMLISCVVLFTGCMEQPTSPQPLYAIDVNYDFDSVQFQLNKDTENERFILTYNIKINTTGYFYVILDYSEGTIRNSNEFMYTDNLDSEIVFNDDGYYEFTGEKIFFITYMNANANIKRDISNDNYSLEICSKTFLP